ncbi:MULTISPECIES: hypothetical protein [unclassified Streptomyces]|uniref:hypothetical protein n=1 Tax=unclassified Streptomyces TaxID=2593676 RepID=UPI0013A6C365|nr:MULTISPECIES: hypothetical protein [unclassified Streptomyces]
MTDSVLPTPALRTIAFTLFNTADGGHPMTTATNPAQIKTDYAQQIAGDLAANQTAQEQTRAELQRLQVELSQLEDNEKVLLKMQEALGIEAEPVTPQVAKRSTRRTSVPAARSGALEKKATVLKPEAAKTSPTRGATEKARTRKKTEGPSWLELVTAVVTGQTGPKSAAEVADMMSAAHPERKVQAAVIRNTLEQGVARGLLERSKQGRSVYYNLVSTPATGPDTESANAVS